MYGTSQNVHLLTAFLCSKRTQRIHITRDNAEFALDSMVYLTLVKDTSVHFCGTHRKSVNRSEKDVVKTAIVTAYLRKIFLNNKVR